MLFASSWLDPTTFLIGWALGGAAAIAVFFHAERHGSRHATAWGIGVFLFLGIALPLYVIHHRLWRRSRRGS